MMYTFHTEVERETALSQACTNKKLSFPFWPLIGNLERVKSLFVMAVTWYDARRTGEGDGDRVHHPR